MMVTYEKGLNIRSKLKYIFSVCNYEEWLEFCDLYGIHEWKRDEIEGNARIEFFLANDFMIKIVKKLLDSDLEEESYLEG